MQFVTPWFVMHSDRLRRCWKGTSWVCTWASLRTGTPHLLPFALHRMPLGFWDPPASPWEGLISLGWSCWGLWMGIHTAEQTCWLGIIIKTWESKIDHGASAKGFASKRFWCKKRNAGWYCKVECCWYESVLTNVVNGLLFTVQLTFISRLRGKHYGNFQPTQTLWAQELLLGPKNHENCVAGSFFLEAVSEGVCMLLPS